MTEPARPYVRHVCAAHQRTSPTCIVHGQPCPLSVVSAVEPGSAESTRLASLARKTLQRSPTVWVQTAYAAGPVGWPASTSQGSVVLGLNVDNSLVPEVARRGSDVPAILAAAELGPAGKPDRIMHRAWLAGWLRETSPLEFEELTRVLIGTVRGPHVAQRLPGLKVLLMDVAEVLVPQGAGSGAIHSVDLTDYALA